MQKLQELSGSCQEGLPEGCSRAREGEGPEARRKRAGHFADVRVTPTFLRLRFFTEHHRIIDEHVLLSQHRCGSASAIPIFHLDYSMHAASVVYIQYDRLQ